MPISFLNISTSITHLKIIITQKAHSLSGKHAKGSTGVERRKFPASPAAGGCPTSVVWQELLLLVWYLQRLQTSILVAPPVWWGIRPWHFAIALLCLQHSCWLLTSGLVLLARSEPGLVWFLQEGARPGHPGAPGAGARQESGDFSASAPCTGELWWREGWHTLHWNWCSSNLQLLLTQDQSQHPASSYTASTHDPKSANSPCSSANANFWLL